MLASAAVSDGKTSLEFVDKYLAFPLLGNEMRAVNVLETAVKNGHKDPVFLSHDLELRALQHVQEFNSLIGSLHEDRNLAA